MKKEVNKIDKNIIGSTGEFFVAAEIARRGGIATLTIKNTPNIDVIATNPKTGKSANLQVKTRGENNKQGWLLDEKVDKNSDIKNHYYIFVNLVEKDKLPEYYIIPVNIFAKMSTGIYEEFLKGKSKNGKKHQPNSARNFKPEIGKRDFDFAKKYRDWNILDIF